MKNTSTVPVTKSPQVTTQETSISKGENTFEALYLKKDYKGAANYLLANKQQLNSGIFHYNLGTVYSKLSDFPAARFHFEKALKEGYINTSSLNNLAFVKSQLQVDDLTTSTLLPDELMNYSLSIPGSAYLTISLLLLLTGMLLVKAKRVKRVVSMVLLGILIIAPVAFSQLYLEKINYAVAFKDISLYEGPSKIFNEKGKIRAGSKIILGDFKEGWFYVKFPISLAGWINKDQIGLY
jgi:tetratricopeptide (TPR) repeat protein